MPVAAEREQRAAAFVRFPVSLSAVLCCHRSMEVPSRRLRRCFPLRKARTPLRKTEKNDWGWRRQGKFLTAVSGGEGSSRDD